MVARMDNCSNGRQNRRYIRLIAALAGTLSVLVIALSVMIVTSQPNLNLEKVAEAETTLPGLPPLVDKDAKSEEQSSTPDAPNPFEMSKPVLPIINRVHDDALALTTAIAFCRYQYEAHPEVEELSEIKGIYEYLLSELNLDFTSFENLEEEIRVISESLEQHPDLWAQAADQLVAVDFLPTEASL